MTDKPRQELERRLLDARRLQMVHYLADRHAEGDKLKPLIEQLESHFRSKGWKLPK
jgi:hypothetical protein